MNKTGLPGLQECTVLVDREAISKERKKYKVSQMEINAPRESQPGRG
jgi:hypothetical protein